MALSLLAKLKRKAPARAEADGGGPQPPRARITGLHGNVRLRSELGLVPIALLRRGDRVRCLEGHFARIAAVDVCRFEEGMMETRADLRPIRIRAGALGNGTPGETVLIAPDQPIAEGTADASAALIPAVDFLGRPGVDRAPATETGYYTLRLESPAILMAEGLWFRA